jgi:hypothetical protein
MMVLPLLFLVGVHDWVPARWGSGDPETLDLLRGGIVNWLLLEAENWNGRFVESARERHLAILGVIHPRDSAPDLARRARQMKLNGIVMEGDFERSVADRIRNEVGLVNPPTGWRFPEIAAGAMTPTRREMGRIQPVWEATYNATVRKTSVRARSTRRASFSMSASAPTRRASWCTC